MIVKNGILFEPPREVGIVLKKLSKGKSRVLIADRVVGFDIIKTEDWQFMIVITTNQEASRKKLIRYLFRYGPAVKK
jgi:hypothetical protein